MTETIFKRVGTLPGKTIAIFAGVHGDEKVGIRVLEKLISEIEVKRGTIIFAYANPDAIEVNKRFLVKNLNRIFSPDIEGKSIEELRARELMTLLDNCDALLDLHSYASEEGDQFAIAEPNGYDIVKTMDFPVVLSGMIEKIHEKSTVGYLHKREGVGIVLECGTTNKPDQFYDIALKSAYQFLQYFNAIDKVVENDSVQQQFIHADRILYKKNEDFKFVRNFIDFEALPTNKPFAFDGDEPIVASENECIIFPRPNVPIGGEFAIIGKFENK